MSHVPSFYRDQETLARYAQLCLLAESGREENCKVALDGLETLLSSSDEAMRAQIQPQYERIHKQYNDLLYETALSHLQNGSYTQALNYLRKVPVEYPDTAELLRYALSRADAKSSDTSYHLQTVLASMEQIPADYSGTFAEEISTFRERLLEMIVASEAREEKIRAEREAAQAAAKKAEEERVAALKASGIPYVGMAECDVNSTRQLGKAAYNDQSSREWVKGADGKYFYDTKQVYAWYSKQNGDMLFKVECKNGVVISAVKYSGDAYWNGDQLLVKLGPQIIHKFNSGGTSNSGSDPSIRDVYDNPEDLYEENRDWFDDEEEAWDYWYED